jgi:hypothetical protein
VVGQHAGVAQYLNPEQAIEAERCSGLVMGNRLLAGAALPAQ